jgi:hypothetical protein
VFTPAAIVVQESQRTDGLVEHVKVPRVQQKTLSGHQSLTSNFKGAREIGVVRISGTSVLTKRHKHLIFHNRAAVCSTDRLILGAFPLGFSSRVAPETIQMLPQRFFILLILTVFHPVRSDYIIEQNFARPALVPSYHLPPKMVG